MIDNFIERVAQRVFELLKPYINEKLEEQAEKVVAQIDEQLILTEQEIDKMLDKWKVALANEVAGRFRL